MSGTRVNRVGRQPFVHPDTALIDPVQPVYEEVDVGDTDFSIPIDVNLEITILADPDEGLSSCSGG